MERSGDETWVDVVRRSAAELLGTFIFVLFVGLAESAKPWTPLVPAFALLSVKYALGHVSLAVVNPALSLSLHLRGAISWKSTISYVVAQLVGGLLGALMSVVFVQSIGAAPTILQGKASLGIQFLAEFVATAILVFVSLNNTSADSEGNSFYGLSAGLTLGVIVFCFAPISGGAVNPSVALLNLMAPIYGMQIPPTTWIYFVAPPLGAIFSAILFRGVSPNDHAPLRFIFKGPVDHRTGSAPHSSSYLPQIVDN